jgi:FAD/FMN-containing dehydrogenase
MTTLDATLVQGLRAGLRGPVLVAGDPGYDETRAIWNAMIDKRPALIARCIGVSDVLACVRFAREHSLTLSMRGGGHNIAGLALAEGGLMLDLSLMRGVWVDTAARVARGPAPRGAT